MERMLQIEILTIIQKQTKTLISLDISNSIIKNDFTLKKKKSYFIELKFFLHHGVRTASIKKVDIS